MNDSPLQEVTHSTPFEEVHYEMFLDKKCFLNAREKIMAILKGT